MLQIDKRHLTNFDTKLLLLIVMINLYGIFAIYSASYDMSAGTFSTFYKKQIAWFVLGLIAFLFFSFLSYKRLIRYAYFLYIVGLFLLSVVLIFGHIGMGAQRWINIGGFRLQPSEIFKIIFVIMLAYTFRDMSEKKLNFIDIFKKMLFLIPVFLLIFLQPDLGTATIFLAVWAMVLLYRGVTRWTFIFSFISFIVILPLLWLNLREYQKNRILTFLNPERDPFGSGYHVIQSKIAIGSGGISGKGFLQGTQTHLKFLPERHTDFIFSLIGEEFGLIGCGVLILLFLILIYRVTTISFVTEEPTAKIICIATASLIFFQTFVNAAMTVSLMPVVGIPMPFVSYGGSSLITFMSLLGIVNSVNMRKFNSPSEY
jgi:rod shape determining protein RodA